MVRGKITRLASRDLESIQEYGRAQFGASVTDDFMEGFDGIFERLERFPHAGFAMLEYGRGLRSCLHKPYRVLYRYEGGEVSILRILHTAQRICRIDDNLP